jgi:hypothetical protein
MQLASLDGAGELMVTIAGYEFPDDLSQEDTANWLEVDLSVWTPHGRGSSRVACMTTRSAAEFADWLDALGARRVGTRFPMLFPEPNLQLKVLAWGPDHVSLHVYFILERPGQWEMDDTPDQEGARYYSGEMDLKLRLAALCTAAASLRAELRNFPRREPTT